jgi:WS/DGAT/MGAT family acyltransferase
MRLPVAYWHYERLSALDAAFLDLEDANAHMHLGAVTIFEAQPLLRPEGGLDFARILALIDAQLEKVPRFRQKLASASGGQPVWVDDAQFNLRYHARHTALPFAGDERRLKRLVGRVMSQQLDRGKPLWELWFVEGLEGNRFAVISKIHHSMSDGIPGIDLLAALIGTDPDFQPKPRRPFNPRPAPPAAQLLASEFIQRARLPLSLLEQAREAMVDTPRSLASAREALGSLGASVRDGLRPPSPTPLNQPVGAHRRFDWIRLDRELIRELAQKHGGTGDDVVLAIAAGALRSFLFGRGMPADELDFRVMVPVRLRPERGGARESRVSSLLAPLPLDERDPRRRLRRVIETMRERRASRAPGGQTLAQVAGTSSALMAGFARLASRSRAANLVVATIPGPPVPVYLLGAPLLEVYPVVPLASRHALSIALFSYGGSLFWGFNSDWDRVRDLHELVESIPTEFEALRKAAAGAPVRASP